LHHPHRPDADAFAVLVSFTIADVVADAAPDTDAHRDADWFTFANTHRLTLADAHRVSFAHSDRIAHADAHRRPHTHAGNHHRATLCGHVPAGH
jgi:hypothetical protein